MPAIERLSAQEILDSRGRPTVLARCKLAGCEPAGASVPSGASTGTAEAHELRDGNPGRYRGLGCKKAVAHIKGEIHHALAGKTYADQSELDNALINLDGTGNKSRLGANAILAISIAFARANAAAKGVPLWQELANFVGNDTPKLPQLTINLFSGGRHAGSQVAIQDVLLVPKARSIDESLASASDVYHAAAELCREHFGMRLLRADEGGLAPPFRSSEEMIAAANECIARAGYKPGEHFSLAVDSAATQFYSEGFYRLDDEELDSQQMIGRIKQWAGAYGIVSVEDGLAEDDWNYWPRLNDAIGSRCLVMGDDLLCTNPARIQRAIDLKAANALLLKVNQIGTLTEAAAAYKLARSVGWSVTVSARSGETEDNWLADLVVGWAGNQLKIGSITQSDRLSKYNRLLEIEAQF